MYLEGKVQTAKINDFFSGLELKVVDRGVEKRPMYTVRVVRGWPGLEELREMKKQNATVEQMFDYVQQQMQLPQEDQVLSLIVVDVEARAQGKQVYKTLICELAPAGA